MFNETLINSKMFFYETIDLLIKNIKKSYFIISLSLIVFANIFEVNLVNFLFVLVFAHLSLLHFVPDKKQVLFIKKKTVECRVYKLEKEKKNMLKNYATNRELRRVYFSKYSKLSKQLRKENNKLAKLERRSLAIKKH